MLQVPNLTNKDWFILRAVSLLTGYFILWYSPLMPLINAFLTENTADFAGLILNITTDMSVLVKEMEVGYRWVVCSDDRNRVGISHPCNAFELYSLYLGFVVAITGVQPKRKWVFAPIGVLLIYLFNAARVVGLFLIHGRWPQVFNFMHKYVFQASAYLLIFALWYALLMKDEKPS